MMTAFHIISCTYMYIQRLRLDVEDKKAQLRALGKEVEQRDAEISKLMGELCVANSQALIVRHQVCIIELYAS